MAASRKLLMAALALTPQALVSVALVEDDGPLLPWDVIRERLAELLRFLASALPELAARLRDWASTLALLARSAIAVALPAAAAVALIVVFCRCVAGGVGRRRRGPDGEEASSLDGPVVRYRAGGYRGGIFSLHPNKPIRG
ncbi:hypothetical protein GUJ93_ZPchr0012g21431 [Zizania palustris]|uniref:Uncharacterized protein n=1 Tax=Zizania palustris TaxID=103762 RepID=A0A8J5WL37_ZIZPA|nr:hypothetical protein GUJ93_ZPchr0012g21431 [Zizania palustris]